MHDASNRKSIRRAEKAAALAERNRREVLVSIASTEPGRRWLWEQLEAAHIFTTPYNDNPQRMAFLVGEQNRGLALLGDFMAADPDNFIQAMREANARRTADAAADDRTVGERPGDEEPGWDDQGPGADLGADDSEAD